MASTFTANQKTTMCEKVQSLDSLPKILEAHRSQNHKIIHCHGVFDLLHIGHIKHLNAAKQLGDILIVSITPDHFVNKGPHRPAFPEKLRAEALAALSCVDYVTINRWPTAVEIINLLKPDIYVKGIVKTNGKRDHTDAITDEEKAVEQMGGKLVLTDEETYSASALINRFMDVFTPEAASFLENLRSTYSVDEIIGHVQAIRPLKVLTVGEIILDEYVFCSQMGKANKEAVLAVRYNYTEIYAGGILAIANHVSNVCDNVSVASLIGEVEPHADFIKKQLNDNVLANLIVNEGARTIIKRRFVEEYLGTKMFEVYVMDSDRLASHHENQVCEELESILPDYDVVIVADYGHGMLTEKAISLLCEKAKFLAVNTQTNAGNMGFNTISKYPRADFISIAEPEIRLDMRDMDSDIRLLIEATAKKLSCDQLVVTRGKLGALCFHADKGFYDVPAFAIKMLDRIGAGDAFLSLTAPLAANGTPMEIIGFIGNVAGAEACAIMGNKTAVNPSSMFRHITSLMQ